MNLEEILATVEKVLPLTRLDVEILQLCWQEKSYKEISQELGYNIGHVKNLGASLWQRLSDAYGIKITKQNLKIALRQVIQSSDTPKNLSVRTPDAIATTPYQQWGTAIDVSIFYGRTQELQTLEQWLLHDQCRLITLLGMGGMGKTALSVKVAEQVQDHYEYLLWRSLRDAPLLDDLLAALIQFLSNQQEIQLPASLTERLAQLVELLRRSHCLIILDNFDTILQEGKRAGTYRSGYEEYGELLKSLGEIRHQSSIILTTREKPQEIAILEGELLPIRTLPLLGLEITAGQEILNRKGLKGTDIDTAALVDHYRGNPLAIKIAATSIQDLFAGNIAQFLAQGTTAFAGISTLLAQQCDRLSPLEQQIMYWLAINREPVTVTAIQADLATETPLPRLMEVLESLRWRGLIESSSTGFTQQPVVMEFITEQLLDQVCEEILSETVQVFSSHALIKAQVKDYIRESQIRVILKPLIERLVAQLGSVNQLEHKLGRLLLDLREQAVHQLLQQDYAGGNLLNLFRQLETDLTEYDFSRLCIRQAYLQDVNLPGVNFTQSKFVDCAFASTFGGITSVAINPWGDKLATSDTNGDIQIWSISEGKQIALYRGHNSWVWGVVFSPTQPLLASCGQDHTIRLWDVETGTCLKVLTGHTGIVNAIAVSPDGLWVASGSGDYTVRIWNVATGDCTQVLQGHGGCVWSVVFHPDGKMVLSGGEDKTIKVWDLATGECRATFVGHQYWVKAIALSPDGTLLASGGFDQTIKLWNLRSRECVATLLGHHKTITSLAFSPDGQILASGSYDQTVRLWQIASGRCIHTLQKHNNLIWSVAFHPQGHLLASGGEDYTARLWDIHTGQCTKTIQGHRNSVYAIALNAEHHLLASGHEDQTIKLWDFNDKTLTQQTKIQPFKVLRGHRDRAFRVKFSPNGKLLASGSFDRTAKLWNPYTGQCLHTFQGHKSWIWGLNFSPDNQTLATGSYDHLVKLWDIKTGECLQTLVGHPNCVLTVAFSPNNPILVSGGYEQTIKFWDLHTGTCLDTWQAHFNRVWAITFSPDGQRIATGGDDRTVKLWDLHTQACLQTFSGHTSQILEILFTADPNCLITSSADGTIKTWDIATGNCLTTLEGHTSWVWSLALCPDQQTLLSGSQDETLKGWNLATQACLKTFQSPRPYEGMNIHQATGLTEVEQLTLKALGALYS